MKRHIAFAVGAAVIQIQAIALAGESSSFEQDRRAILAMAGKFAVEFNFQETVSLRDGYELKKPYHEEALEMVEVVEDSGKRIILQHILLADDGLDIRVVKHWGQIWTYEDREIIEYQGDRTWKKRTLKPKQVAGTWTQLVTQVDDSPRYESWGKWTHDSGRSAWQSQDTPRPLPRREHTKRSDYQILMAVNRQVITPNGWVHEQDNRKWNTEEDFYFCHEVGLNRYVRCDEDFTAAEKQWESTKAFWQEVRAEWEGVISENETIAYHKEVGGSSLMKQTSSLARKVMKGEDLEKNAVENLIARFTKS